MFANTFCPTLKTRRHRTGAYFATVASVSFSSNISILVQQSPIDIAFSIILFKYKQFSHKSYFSFMFSREFIVLVYRFVCHLAHDYLIFYVVLVLSQFTLTYLLRSFTNSINDLTKHCKFEDISIIYSFNKLNLRCLI